MKILCVAEKPSIAKSVAEILSSGHGMRRNPGQDKYCGNFEFNYRFPPDHTLGVRGFDAGFADVTMTSVRGHLTDQSFGEQYNGWRSCNPSVLFTAPIISGVSKDAENIAKNLKACARRSDLLMIWTDCDREGEHIGSEVVSICRQAKRNLPVKRAKFSAIIANQIHRAMTHPVELDWNAVAAVESRIEMDLRLGAAFSRLQTLALQQHFAELQKRVVSYGPCQFPTLGFVVEQYYKVMDFVPEPFWYIAVMKKRDNFNVDFRWSRKHLFVEQEVNAIYQRCIANPEATVKKVNTKQTRKFKPHPLTTVELQKSGGRILHMAAKRILDVAEKLYNRGILSYPRTETDQYDPAFDFRTLIEKQKGHPDWGTFATTLNDEGTNAFEKPINGSKNDKAHPPIHPTKPAIDLVGDEKRVYEFVTRRFLASCSKHAVGKETTVDLDIASEKFSASGVVVVARNYLDVYPYDSWGGPALPEFEEGERFQPTKIEKKEGETTRPKLLTESDLVALMDRHGIGTDATIADHIEKIIFREYVMIQPEGKIKYLVPSTLGMGLVEGYNSIERLQDERSLCKPQLRRQTEERMTLICQGTRTKAEMLEESLGEYKEVFEKVESNMQNLLTSMNRYLRGPVPGEDVEAALLAGDEQDDGPPPHPPHPPPPQSRSGLQAQSNATDARQEAPRSEDNYVIDLDDIDDEDFLDIVEPAMGPSVQSAVQPPPRPPPPPAHANGRPSADEGFQCRCGMEAQKRVVRTGNNVGRSYYGCSKPQAESCEFFQWDDGNSGPARNQPAAAYNRSPAPPSDDVRRCGCQLEAKKLTVSKDGPNKGRAFWMCPNISKMAQCKYFEWDDEPPRQQQDQPYGASSSSARGGGGGGGQECFTCGETGHWSSACPQKGVGGGGGQDRGYGVAASSTRGGGDGGGGGGGQECFTCGETGHWSSACPQKGGGGGGNAYGGGNQQRGSSSSRGARGATRKRGGASNGDGGGARGGTCFKCNGKGHWASECTEPEGSTSGGGRGRGGRGGGGKRRKT